MAIELLMSKTAGGLIPLEPQDPYEYEILPFGKPIRIKATVARSSPQNRWFHSCLNILYKQQDLWPTPELFKQAVKRALGLFILHEIKGKPYYEYPSIAFDKMEQHDFNDLCNRFVKLVCERIIPNMTEEEARRMLDLLDANSGKLGTRQTNAA